MTTMSISREVNEKMQVSQGDIFKNVKFAYIDSENDEVVNIIEFEFPLAIVVSQACDVIFMSELQERRIGSISKFMPSILLCPIYDKQMIKDMTHLAGITNENVVELDNVSFFNSKEIQVVENELHYRFHSLNVKNKNRTLIADAVIDFKHCFSVSMKYLSKNKDNRLASLEPIFAEQVTLKFSNYISRVAIP